MAAPESSAPAAMPAPAPEAGASTSSNDGPAPEESGPQAALPLREKDRFERVMVERFYNRDQANSAREIDAAEFKRDMTPALSRRYHYFKGLLEGTKPGPDGRPPMPPKQPAELYGEGYAGYGNGRTNRPDNLARIIYPSERKRPGGRMKQPLRWRRKDVLKQAEQHEELVPIRIDVELDKIKLRDTFTWNLHDRLVRPEDFAQFLVEDFGLRQTVGQASADAVRDQVVGQIREQLIDFYPFAFSEEDALDPELPYSAYKNDEMRILIKLDITVGQHTLVDQFEWDINNPLNSPEEFAQTMSRDLSLSGEFTTAIAHSIREQVQLFTRSLYSIGHPFDGRPVEDPDMVSAFLQSPLPSVFRPQQQAKEYAPYLWERSDAELERNEVIISREQRRQKRSVNRRGGPSLPDLKDRQRTIRTLIVSSVIPGAAPNVDESRIFKRPAMTASGRGGRRGRTVGEGDSDSEESEDSAPESPAPSALAAGTARTRGIRSAALGAAQRMANLGRSETPEVSTLSIFETPRPTRRAPREHREDTEEPGKLIVTLRLAPAQLRRAMSQPRSRPTPSTPIISRESTVVPGSMGPPPAVTPSAMQASPAPVSTPANPGSKPEQSLPSWLVKALGDLQAVYKYDWFEGFMKPVKEPASAGSPDGAETVSTLQPRIRCKDCSNKIYYSGPGETVENFERHLKLPSHRNNVNTRVGKPTAPQDIANE